MSSFRSISSLAIAGTLSLGAYAGTSESCPSNTPYSCQNSSAVADTCCFNAPGGQLLQTQFWDTNPSTGPSNSWTVHGLWPDHCDGTFDANCDSRRAYTNITQILQSYGQNDLLTYMKTYWPDYQGNDESFWEHEWGKHGTCISTLNPDCYTDYTAAQEVVDFFSRTVDLFKGLDTYTFLSNANILPSKTQNYTSDAIFAALKAPRGVSATIQCVNGALDEVWYSFNVKGSVQQGTFEAAEPDGSKSSCPNNVAYLPKSGSGSSPTTTGGSTKTTTGTSPTSTGGSFSGKGYLNVYSSGAQKGSLISSGNWYVGGTPATITASSSGSGFTLSSSKGTCGITSGNVFACGSGVSSVFTSSGGNLAYKGQSTFYATSVPSGTAQVPVHTDSNSVSLQISWQSV